MNRTATFMEKHMSFLDFALNEFIEDKEVINVSITYDGHYYIALVLYKEQ